MYVQAAQLESDNSLAPKGVPDDGLHSSLVIL